MIILAVIGVIILVFAALLNVPVTAHIRYYGRKLDVSVKYFGIGIFPKKARKKRTKKRETSKPPPEAEDEEEIFEDIAQLGFEEKQRNSEISENDDEGGISEDELYDALENDRENSDEGTGNLTEAFRENSEGNGEKKTSERKKDKAKTKNNPQKKTEGKKGGKAKKSLGERISEIADNFQSKKNAAVLLWELCGGHIKKLLGKISVTGLVIDFAAADEDAAEAAVKYGKLSAGFYNFLGVLMSITRVGIKSVNVDCLYNTPAEKSRYDGEFKVRLRPASVTNALLAVLIGFVRGGEKYKNALNEFIGGND